MKYIYKLTRIKLNKFENLWMNQLDLVADLVGVLEADFLAFTGVLDLDLDLDLAADLVGVLDLEAYLWGVVDLDFTGVADFLVTDFLADTFWSLLGVLDLDLDLEAAFLGVLIEYYLFYYLFCFYIE